MEIVEPDDGDTVHGTVTVWICAWDEDGNEEIQDVWARIDWGAWLNATFSHTTPECSWWYYDWDSTGVEDGWHHISALASDGVHMADDAIEVFVDNVPENHAPHIVITEPSDGEEVSGTVVIRMCAWDPDGLDQIQDVWVKLDNGPWLNATYDYTGAECSWWYYEWDTTGVPDGWHHIKAIAYDGEYYADDLVEVFVDNVPENHPPGVEITEPSQGETVDGVVTIRICAWDPDGNDQIQDVWVRIDGGSWLNATYDHTDGECSWWFYEWDTTVVADGWHHITAIAFDGQFYADDGIEVYVNNILENRRPGVEIVEPHDGDTVSGTITIWICAWDPDGNDQIQDVWVRFDHGAWLNATYNNTDPECSWWYFVWDTTGVEDGWHHIGAIAFDGHLYADDGIEVFVDNIQENHIPGVEITEPDSGDTVSGVVTVWVCAWDPDGNDEIQDVWVRIDQGAWLNATYDRTDPECSWWFYEWDTTGVDDGWHHISALVYDGHAYEDDAVEVFVDNNLDENHRPGVVITEPDDGDTVSGTITIWICAWDPDGNDQIQDVWVRFDHGAWHNATYNHTNGECSWWFYEWDTTGVSDGWHHVGAIAFDGALYADDGIEVFVDNVQENHPPGVEITSPQHGATVNGTVTIWICAWDPDGNDHIQDVWVKIDNGTLLNATYHNTTGECSWWFYEWDTTGVDNGWHLITAIAFDGIDDAHDSIEVRVENEGAGGGGGGGGGGTDLLPFGRSPSPDLLPLISTMLAVTLMGLFAAAGTEAGKFGLLKLLFLPLYTRMVKKDVLEHFVRGQIYGYIKVHPGDNYSTIKKNLDLENGTLTYHLSVLEREELIKSWSKDGHKYFYPMDMKIPANGEKNPSIYDAIMKCVRESPGISVGDVAAVTGISRQLANYHIRKLVSEGRVECRRESFTRGCYPANGGS